MRRSALAVALLLVVSLHVVPSAHAAPCFDYDQILPEVDRVTLAAAPVSIVIGGSHAFVAVSELGLQVVDVSDPAALSIIATLGGLGTVKDIALDGTLLYAGSTTGLHVIDVSDPASPELLGSAPVLWNPWTSAGRRLPAPQVPAACATTTSRIQRPRCS